MHTYALKEIKGALLSTDLSGIGLRLRDVRKNNDLTQPVMAAAIDVSDRTYKYYEQEKRELPALAAVKISDRFNINLEWLLTGNGQVLKGDNPALAEVCSLAVLNEHNSRQSNLPFEKLSKIIGFVAERASQTGEHPTELAQKYFDTL